MNNKIILDAKNLIIIVSDEMELELKKLIQYDGFERAGVLMGSIYPKTNKIKIIKIIESKYKFRDRYNVEVDTEYLNDEISKEWKANNTVTYIGDWHTHPEDIPYPSDVDIETIKDKFNTGTLSQNILIDIIIGRDKNFIKSFDGQNFYNINIEQELKKEISDES